MPLSHAASDAPFGGSDAQIGLTVDGVPHDLRA